MKVLISRIITGNVDLQEEKTRGDYQKWLDMESLVRSQLSAQI